MPSWIVSGCSASTRNPGGNVTVSNQAHGAFQPQSISFTIEKCGAEWKLLMSSVVREISARLGKTVKDSAQPSSLANRVDVPIFQHPLRGAFPGHENHVWLRPIPVPP